MHRHASGHLHHHRRLTKTSGALPLLLSISLGLAGCDSQSSSQAVGSAQALDAAAALSAGADLTPPSAPSNLTWNATGMTVILSWGASTDDVGVAGYQLFFGNFYLGLFSDTSLSLIGFKVGTPYNFTVKAIDAAGNLSQASNQTTVLINPIGPDTTPPSAPSNLAITNSSTTSVTLQWSASTDDVGVVVYQIYANATLAGTVPAATTGKVSNLTPNTTYTFTVKAVDGAGNVSAPSNGVSRPVYVDTTPPSVPTGLTASNVTSTSLVLSWNASTDNVGVVAYDIYGSNTEIVMTTTGTSLAVSDLRPAAQFGFMVRARDAAGNSSAVSSQIFVTTLDPSLTLPPAGGRFDYQIGGAYTPVASVRVVDRDRSDAPVNGKYNICYVNAFQTQPAEATFWHTSHADLLLTKAGAEVTDPNWPGEIVLDTSTAAKREAIAAIVGGWMATCQSKGFQAVEPDNLDSWTRSQNLLTEEDNVALAKLLAVQAHSHGLAIAQKNTSELASRHAEIGFDFAVVEECQPYGDCDAFTSAYGARWYEVEYTDAQNALKNFKDACNARGSQVSVILRDRDVAPLGDSHYVYQVCSDVQ